MVCFNQGNLNIIIQDRVSMWRSLANIIERFILLSIQRYFHFGFMPYIGFNFLFFYTKANSTSCCNYLFTTKESISSNNRDCICLSGSLLNGIPAKLFNNTQAAKRKLFALTTLKWSHYDARAEYERQGILNLNSNWRLTTLNEKYALSETYVLCASLGTPI